MTHVLTHRGLDPSRPRFPESSRAAFADQLERGFGLEFDVRISKDGKVVILHDSDLARLSGGADERRISDLSLAEIHAWEFSGHRVMSLRELLDLIAEKRAQGKGGTLHAMHVKRAMQEKHLLDILLAEITAIDRSAFILFDLSPDSARYLLEKDPSLQLAASVSHPFDKERYSEATGGTLLTIDEAISHKPLFAWAWLDEWDRLDRDGTKKTLYSKKNFDLLRKYDFRLALVTPELHATSPGLVGGEAHEDAATLELLLARMEEIISLRPDAICTDYPEEAREMARRNK